MPSPYVHFTEAQAEAYIALTRHVATLSELNQMQDQEEARLIQACYTYHSAWRCAELDQRIVILKLEADEAHEVGGDVSGIERAIAEHVAEQKALELETVSFEHPNSNFLPGYNEDLARVRATFHKLREHTEEPFLNTIFDVSARAMVEELYVKFVEDAVSFVDELFKLKNDVQFAYAFAAYASSKALPESTGVFLNNFKGPLRLQHENVTDEQFERVWLKKVLGPCQGCFYETALKLLHDELSDEQRDVAYKNALLPMIDSLLLSLNAEKFQKHATCPWTKQDLITGIKESSPRILSLVSETGGLQRSWQDVAEQHAFDRKMCLGFAALALVPMVITAALPYALGLSFGLSMIALFACALSLGGLALAIGKASYFRCKVAEAEVKQEDVMKVYGNAVSAVEQGGRALLALKSRFFPSGDGVVDEGVKQEHVFKV
jgi:hypothetical protein